MSAGRPKTDPKPFKQYKAYHTSGNHEERLRQKEAKERKIAMMETILHWWEAQPVRDTEYIRDLCKRLNQLREQARCLSTTNREELDWWV